MPPWQVHGEFRTYVRPTVNETLTAFCTELTGIQQAQVDGGPQFGEALSAHTAWLRRHGIAVEGVEGHSVAFVTCGDWDLQKMLPAQLGLIGGRVPQHFRQWVNVKHVFKHVFKHNPKGMVGMLERLGLTLEGRHHSGIDDCRNISKVVRALAQRGVVLECTATTEGVGQAGAFLMCGRSGSGRGRPDVM